MEATVKNNYLMMVLYLMTKISNMRQGILSENMPVVHPEILNQISSEIKVKYNVDISSLKNKEEMLNAERILGDFLNQLVSTNVTASAEDELMLFNDSIELDKGELKNAHFHKAKELLGFVKSMGMTNPQLIDSWLRNLDYIRYFKVLDSENILATKKINISGVDKILFTHIIVHRAIYTSEIQYEVANIIIVSYEKFKDMLGSPIRLFLYLLDEYGIKVNYNGKEKKLYYKEEAIGNTSISLSFNSKQMFAGVQNIKDKDNGKEYFIFVYGFDYELFLKDYRSYKI